MKKLFLFLLLNAILLFSIPICAWGSSAGSHATGAKLPCYKKVITKAIDTSEDFSTSMRNYLLEAAKNASGSIQYKIIIPPGTYTARYWQNIPSNTWVYAKGATIQAIKGKKRMVLLTNQEVSKPTENIVIEGGVWDTTTQSMDDSPETAPFRFAHVKNLFFKDMTIQCNRKSHLIEVSDINGMTVSGCKISGNNYCTDVQPKEAIQLDVATQAAMVNMQPYNGKGCHNVLVEGNSFNKVARGIGSHNDRESIVEVNPYTQVTIRNNTFINLKGEAIYLKWWKSGSIEKNTIKNGTRAGIFMESSSKIRVTNNDIKKYSPLQVNESRHMVPQRQELSYGTVTTTIYKKTAYPNAKGKQ